MANPAPTINQINAFNATQGTTIDFNIIGGTELVRSNRIYIYDLSDNSLICTHLYVSTESIHELPPNTDASIVYESGKSSADFVNGTQYYAQIQTFTDIGGTEGGSGLSVAKMFWCLVDPTLTITTIPSTISTTSYNVSATYNANTSVVSNIIQQYQFSLYSATGSLLQSSGVVVGSGEQQGTSTAYDISYNFSGLSVGSSYYVVVDVTTTQGMSVSAQSGTFTVSIDTPTLGEATVVNNACDGYISVTSNLSGEYGGSGSGDIVSFETDSENVFTKLQVAIEPTQTGSGTPSPSNVRPIYGVGGVDVENTGVNIWNEEWVNGYYKQTDGTFVSASNFVACKNLIPITPNTKYWFSANVIHQVCWYNKEKQFISAVASQVQATEYTSPNNAYYMAFYVGGTYGTTYNNDISINYPSTDHDYHAYDGQTVSQDFNVSLTPTSTDTDPYLFKAVGDIYGDRLEEDIVGATVNWNQHVNGYSDTDTTHTTSGGVVTITPTTSSNRFIANENNNYIRVITGHKYLALVEIKSDGEHNVGFQNYLIDGTKKTNSSSWTILSVIVNATSTGSVYFQLYSPSNTVYQIKDGSFNVIDLTAFFGNATIADAIYAMETANAGDGVAFMRKYFPTLFTADYDAGTLKSVNPTAHKMVGKNLFDISNYLYVDGYWSGGVITETSGRRIVYIPCLPNTTYTASRKAVTTDERFYLGYTEEAPNGGGSVYGSVAAPTSQTVGNKMSITTTTGANAKYLVCWAYWGNHTEALDTLQFELGATPTDYTKYEEHTYELGNVELRGIPKLDASNNLYYDGDTYESDGAVTRKYGIVTLNGTQAGSNFFERTNTVRRMYNPTRLKANATTEITIIADKPVYKPDYVYTNDIEGISENKNNTQSGIWVSIDKSKLSEVSTAGVTAYLAEHPITIVYPLATPTTETTTPFEQIQEVSKYGTLEYITTNDVPVGHNTTYYTRDVFGATIDLPSGLLTVDRVYRIYDGSDGTWILSASWGKTNTAVFYNDELLSDIKYESFDDNPYLCETLPTASRNELYENDVQAFGFSGALNHPQATVRINKTIASDVTTFVSWITANPLHIVVPLVTPLTYQLTPQQINTLVGVNNVWSEQGDVELSYHIPITNLLVKRQDVDDVSGNWLTLYSQPIEQASDMDFTFIDFLNQYGKTYKYALVPLLTQTQSGVEVEVEGGYTVSDEVQSIFDGVFISDSTGSQKCKASVGYGNVNMNQSVGSITPIGSQYPIIVTNSNNRYHNGSISGMIVPDDYYFNGNLSRIDMVNKRNELEQFLTNKRAKIIKDWNSNIWLVMIMDNIDCSFDNNYGMGMVTFNANWLEVGDPTNQEDLQATGLVNVGGV